MSRLLFGVPLAGFLLNTASFFALSVAPSLSRRHLHVAPAAGSAGARLGPDMSARGGWFETWRLAYCCLFRRDLLSFIACLQARVLAAPARFPPSTCGMSPPLTTQRPCQRGPQHLFLTVHAIGYLLDKGGVAKCQWWRDAVRFSSAEKYKFFQH